MPRNCASSSSTASIEMSCLRRSAKFPPGYASDSSSAASNAAESYDSPLSVARQSQVSYDDCSGNTECSSRNRVEDWDLDEVDPLGALRISAPASKTDEVISKEMEQIFPDRNHARLVYTCDPPRKTSMNLPANVKKHKQQNESRMTPMDQRNPNLDEPGLSMKFNKAELLKLQSQVEELKAKVRDKEEMLQSIKQAAQSDIKLLEEEEILDLHDKVDRLQKELLRRDFLLHSLQHQLSEKHEGMTNMRFLIQGLQNEIVKRDRRHWQMERDMEELRLEVAAMRYENQIAGTRFVPHPGQIQELRVDQQMEETRNKYLAAVLAAKKNPAEETMALAADLRRQLRGFISLPHVFPE